MSKWFGRSSVVALAVLAITGCGGGGGGDERFPDNTLEIRGVRAQTEAPADVLYSSSNGGTRWIRVFDVSGAYVELAFIGEGDWHVLEYELPADYRWTGFDTEFVGLTICEPAGAGYACRDYSAADSNIEGEMVLVGDTVHRMLSFGGGFGLDNGVTAETVIWSYTGDYDYLPDL